MAEYKPPVNPYNPYLFPSREGRALSRSMADKLLRAACQRIGVEVAMYNPTTRRLDPQITP